MIHMFSFTVPKVADSTLSMVTSTSKKIVEEFEEEKLIMLVRARPLLFDHSLDIQERAAIKLKNGWQEVCVELSKPVTLFQQVANHWHTLRNKYMKAKKVLLAKPKSGSAAKPKTTNFIYYHQIDEFLSDKPDGPTE